MPDYLRLPALYEAAHCPWAPRLRLSGVEAKQLRESVGLPLAAVAAAVEASEPTLSRWESGRTRRPRGAAEARYERLLAYLTGTRSHQLAVA